MWTLDVCVCVIYESGHTTFFIGNGPREYYAVSILPTTSLLHTLKKVSSFYFWACPKKKSIYEFRYFHTQK